MKQLQLNNLDLLFNNYAWRQQPCVLSMSNQTIDARRIMLPLPPSDNARLTIGFKRRQIISSPAYRQWNVRAAACLAKNKQELNIFAPDTTDLLHVLTYVIMHDRRRDSTNYEKSLFDCFQKCGHLFANDVQIVERHTVGIYCKEAPCEYVVSFLSKCEDMPAQRDYVMSETALKQLNDYIKRGFEAHGKKVHPAA